MPRRLLIVEDERIVALDLSATLEELGYCVVGTAASCEEALSKAEQGQPDLALMDIRLKGSFDGIETAAMLRARYRLPIVFLSANADNGTLNRAIETAPEGYLAKPYSQRSLRTAVEVALRRHEAEQALQEAHGEERRRFEQRSNELVVLAEQLRQEANVDPLTNLYNRRHLDCMLARQLTLAERDGSSIGFILLDIDRFKRLNDTFGHAAGDTALQTVAHFLRRHMRAHDVACRYGGEEILIVVPGASLHDIFALAERLRAGIAELQIEAASQRIRVTVSLGVAAFPDHGLTQGQLVSAADAALYAAKSAGRNCVIAARV